MAVPAVVGRQGSGPRPGTVVASGAQPQVKRYAPRRAYALTVLGLTLIALLTRVYTTNSLAGEPTPDEYLYGVQARDLARSWSAGESVSLDDVSVEGRSVVVEAAAFSLVLPSDPITLGRTLQALFNALCIPMAFVLGRQVGMARSAALLGALLLMAIPEFQELAWRFWTDSQTTLLCLVYLAALVSFARRTSVRSGVLAVVSLGLLLLTKESAAVTFTPFLFVAALPLGRRFSGSRILPAAVALASVLLLGGALVFLAGRASGDLARNALVERTFGAGPLILGSLRAALPVVPTYLDQLVTVIGPVQLGPGFLWATLIGFAWLLVQAGAGLFSYPPRIGAWGPGWVGAAAAWLPAMVVAWRDVVSLGQTEAWVLVSAGALVVAIGTIEQHLRNARRPGWGIALLGLVAAAVLAERLVISVTPRISGAALTFRLLMPVVPLYALVAGGGLWAAAGAPALLLPGGGRAARSTLAVIVAAILIVFWSPLLHERLSAHALLGRVADRGADPDTPQGLRVQVLVDAEPWLQANLRPSDVILTGVGLVRHLAWYADLGVDGMSHIIDLGSQPRTPEERRQYVLDRVGPTGVDYVVDFNVDWTDPASERARQWRQTFDALAVLPNLESAYVVQDKYGYPVFYVIRNRGYAVAPKRSY